MHYELYLPFPPTVNNYYSKTRYGIYITPKGRQFRAATADCINEQLPGVLIEDRMLVEIILHPPDRRTRDVDNYNKSLLDSITKAGLWVDDSLIDQLFVYRGVVTRGGSIFIRITDACPILPVGYELPMN